MFFGKKKPEEQPGPPPPWVNIDKVPKRPSLVQRFDIVDFIARVTGFSRLGAKFFLIGLALALIFLSYIIFQAPRISHPLPRDAERPAIDKNATSSYIRIP